MASWLSNVTEPLKRLSSVGEHARHRRHHSLSIATRATENQVLISLLNHSESAHSQSATGIPFQKQLAAHRGHHMATPTNAVKVFCECPRISTLFVQRRPSLLQMDALSNLSVARKCRSLTPVGHSTCMFHQQQSISGSSPLAVGGSRQRISRPRRTGVRACGRRGRKAGQCRLIERSNWQR